jgi:hypothetical protein
VTLQKYFSHPSCSYLLSSNPTHGNSCDETLNAMRQEERADGKSFNQNWRKIEYKQQAM